MSAVQPVTPLLRQTRTNTMQRKQETECNGCCILRIFNVFPIFHPFGGFKLIWDPILILVLTISAIEIPFTLVFEENLTLNSFIGILALSIDIFLCVDILINFRTAYFDEIDPLQLITSPKYIAMKYLKTRFLFDLITSFPFEFIVLNDEKNVTEYMQILRVLRIVRLLKVVRIIKMMRLFDKLPKRLSISPEFVIYIKIIKVFFGMILAAHYIACIWWQTGKSMVEGGYMSWIDEVDDIDLHSRTHIMLKYTYSYYWAIITLFTTGYGDIHAENALECWVSVCCVVIGTVYTSYLIGLITNLIREGDRVKHQQTKMLKNAILFCEFHNLSEEISHAVDAHIRYHCAYNYVLSDPEHDVLNNLPKHLQKEIEVEIACKTLKDIDFLNEYLPLELIGQIAIRMKSISCNAGHWLYKKNDIGDELYIQRTGISIIYYHNNQFEMDEMDAINEMDEIQRGDVVGEYSLYSNKRKHSLRCLTFSEFYSLRKNDIKDVVVLNYVNGEKIWNQIRNAVKISNDRKRRNIHDIDENNNDKNEKQIVHDLSSEGYILKKKAFIKQEEYASLSGGGRSLRNDDTSNHFKFVHINNISNKLSDDGNYQIIDTDESMHSSDNDNFEVEMKAVKSFQNHQENEDDKHDNNEKTKKKNDNEYSTSKLWND